MKRFICGLAMVLVMCGSVFAVQETMVGPAAIFSSSGLKTANQLSTNVIISGGGIGAFGGILINGDGTNNQTITIYDSAALSSGTVLFKGTCTSSAYTCVFGFPWPIKYDLGLVFYVNAGTPTVVIYYDDRGK
jgi:hypothetical protein